jgi:hypothetical protein
MEANAVALVDLLATQGIRGGANRNVLERIHQIATVFWAWSDRQWLLKGATVHVSMIAFERTNLRAAGKCAWLENAHRTLDLAVFAAYGWPSTLTTQQILANLLALNHQRAANPIAENRVNPPNGGKPS